MKRLSFIYLATVILVYFFFSLIHPSIALSDCPPDLLPKNPQPVDGFYQCFCDFNTSCSTPLIKSDLPPVYKGCYQLYNKCQEGYVPGFDKPIDRSEEEFSYFPEYCEGCPTFYEIPACTPQCYQTRACITQEQYDYCQCLYDNEEDWETECKKPGYVPPSPPTPTVTPYELQGTFNCEWLADQNRCTIGQNDTCGYEHGWLACPLRCEEITTQSECNSASFNCESYNGCYGGIPYGCIEAQCTIDNGFITNNCAEENPGCVEVSDDSRDTNCRCAVRGYEGDEKKICCTLGANPPSSGAEIFCKDNDPNQRTSDPKSGKIATAIGCIKVDSTKEFVTFLLRWATGIAGGIAFILIFVSGIMILTSSGNPQKIQAGKELMTAAISGLLFLIFGAFILKFIGVDILKIPGFGQ